MAWYKVLIAAVILVALVAGIRYMVDQGGTQQIRDQIPGINIQP